MGLPRARDGSVGSRVLISTSTSEWRPRLRLASSLSKNEPGFHVSVETNQKLQLNIYVYIFRYIYIYKASGGLG